MHRALKLRSGRVIAICRTAVAIALLATALAEAGSVRPIANPSLLLMTGYLASSIVLMAVARQNWWLGHHLAKLAFAVDFVVAFTLLYLSEVAVTGSVSPFMALFIFLVLSATLQWQARGALFTGLLCVVAYLVVAAVLHLSGQEQDNPWFLRRLIFMITISGFVVWFGLHRDRLQAERLDWPLDAGPEEQFATISRYVMEHLPATGFAIAWSPHEEPWTLVYRAGSLGDGLHKGAPQIALSECPVGVEAILFDRRHARGLQLAAAGRVEANRERVQIALADQLDVATGIAAPIRSEIGIGVILLVGIPAVSADHLLPAKLLADELGYALDRHEMVALMQHQEAVRLRADFARDLHDSVAQSLAGSEFRIAALRQNHAAGREIAADLAAIQDSLGKEARHVHAMIADLRRLELHAPVIDAGEDLRRALEEAVNRWGISGVSTIGGDLGNLRKGLVRELQLTIREAVANAVRHAGAKTISMSVEGKAGMLALRISNDGAGFPEEWLGEMPQSIAERVQDLGGTLEIDQDAGQTDLSILIPREQR